MDDSPAPAAGAGPAQRRGGRWTPLLLLLAIGGASLFLAAGPIRGDCGFRVLTGAPCPGCGMTRAVLALAEGDAATAWRMHPAVFALAAAVAAAVAAAAHEGITGRPSFRRAAERHGVRAAVAAAVILGAVWTARVVLWPDGSPDPLRPGSPAERLLR